MSQKTNYFVLLFIIQFLVSFCSAFVNLDVILPDGPLHGEILTSRLNRTFVAFQGIPYAHPPVGDLRFAPAQPPIKWTKVRTNLEIVPICTQRTLFQAHIDVIGQEDCLYLNVYTPNVNISSHGTSKLPVMVFIHGGGLEIGSNYLHEPTYLLDKDIVLVVIQYRLGPLGFLSTDDAICPGNEGLKDQVQALRWVQKNIQYFNGDPNLVTIFGQSAGAASVEAHLLSPLSQGLFHRGIIESGSSQAPWFITRSLIKKTKRLATFLGCQNLNSKMIIECLRTKSDRAIIRALNIFEEWHREPMYTFRAVVENKDAGDARFLTAHPKDLLHYHGMISSVPIIVGLNSEEGFFKVSDFVTQPKLMDELKKYPDNILSLSLFYKYLNPDIKMPQKIRKFYFANSTIESDDISSLINLYTDALFTISIDRSVRQLASRPSGSVYLYYFTYKGDKSLSNTFGDPNVNYGVCHGDEMLYLFPFEFVYQNCIRTKEDLSMIDTMTTIWTEFAKNGKPPTSHHWEPLLKNPSEKSELSYLHIINSTHLEQRFGLLKKRVTFWNSIMPKVKDEL